MHLLQHKLQLLHTALRVRVRRQELEIDCITRNLRSLLCGPLEYHLRLLDTSREEGLRLLGPLLEILLFAEGCFRTTETFHIDETRSVFLSLGIREIVDSSQRVSKSRFGSDLSFQRVYFLSHLTSHSNESGRRNVRVCAVCLFLFAGV